MREYELWLDESGDFMQESQTAGEPSIVGGILIEKGQLSDGEITEMVGGNPHATSMDRRRLENVLFPALETICQRHGKLVYFENQERLNTYTNRDLYLRILAAGMVQLMQYLGKDGSFAMDVTIAIRYAPDEKEHAAANKRDDGAVTLHRINEDEYAATLRKYIREQWQSGTFDIDHRTRLNLTVLSARQERRLQLADYACNARFTRGNRMKFTAEQQERLARLFDDDYIYSVHVKTPENTILSMLAIGDVAGALMEFYTNRRPKDLQDVAEDIFDRLRNMSYRLARLQINQFASQVVGMARMETDFERGEAMLQQVLDDFFPRLHSMNLDVQMDEAAFRLKWCLSDMYLRQGDIGHATGVLSDMKDLLQTMNYRVENLRFLYLYLDRRALFEINCMDYDRAVRTMEQAIRCMEDVRSVLERSDVIQAFFGKEQMASEWLGNAYSMKIYAEMFQQRTCPELYQAIREDTETAMRQYEYPGELERNQQYRAHIEMEAGNFREALEWLFRTQQLDLADDLTENCVSYLDDAVQEDHLSRTYYLMYYVEIMASAQQAGETELAAVMHQSLEIQKEIMDELLLDDGLDTDLSSDNIVRKPRIFRDFLRDSLEIQAAEYHPLEIVRWKYGSYLAATGQQQAAEACWERAAQICSQNPDYTVLKMVHLAILMEWLGFRLQNGVPKSKEIWNKANDLTKCLAKDDGLSTNMKEYVSSCSKALQNVYNADKPLEKKAALCYQESRKIAF